MSVRDLCMIVVGVMLVAGIGAAVNDWRPAWVPAWRTILIASGVALIVLLATPTIRNRCRHSSRTDR